jgi:hypothetical protein
MDQGIYMLLPILYSFEVLDRFHDQSAAKPRGHDREKKPC